MQNGTASLGGSLAVTHKSKHTLTIRVCVQSLSHGPPFVTPWTVAHQDPLSMEFSRQEYWSVLPFPPPGYLPIPGIEPESPTLVDGFFTTASHRNCKVLYNLKL